MLCTSLEFYIPGVAPCSFPIAINDCILNENGSLCTSSLLSPYLYNVHVIGLIYPFMVVLLHSMISTLLPVFASLVTVFHLNPLVFNKFLRTGFT
jgi:hypothetical protein